MTGTPAGPELREKKQKVSPLQKGGQRNVGGWVWEPQEGENVICASAGGKTVKIIVSQRYERQECSNVRHNGERENS